MTNIAVTFEGDAAHSTTTAMVTMVGSGEQAGRGVQRGLRYIDDLVRVGGDWKIRRRNHSQVWEIGPG